MQATPDASSTSGSPEYSIQEGNNYSFKFQSTKPKILHLVGH